MSTLTHRSESAFAEPPRSGPFKRLIVSVVAVGVVIAGLAGVYTAVALHDRAATLVTQDRQVMATFTPGTARPVGRGTFPTAVATWTYPVGVTHSEQVAGPLVNLLGRQPIWVDAAGLRTAGPPSTVAIVGGVVLTVTGVLLITALVLAAGLVTTPGWRLQLQAAADKRRTRAQK
jgi:hypothetical protein